LEDMGRPDEGYPIIHVAGTNGKTSTSKFATLLLVAHGLNTGTYTSPHLQKVEERLAINGRMATEEQFALAVSDVAAFADLLAQAGEEPNTYFELTTAAAFAFFADQAVDASVLEVGLGGRLDATNVVDAEVCVLTSIGIEHTEYLGEDVATIAGEKLAIAGANSTLISGPLPDAALEVADARARDLGIHHRHYGKDFSVLDAERGVGGWLATIGGAEDTYEDIFLPLHGRYQLVNLANAVAAGEALIGRKLDVESVRSAVATATMPGRMEPLGLRPLVMVDGAHNADGVVVLAESLEEEYPTIRWQLVLGVMGDKNVEAMVERLAPLVRGIVVTAPETERAVPPEALAERVRGLVDIPVLVAEDVGHALDMARAEAGPDGAVLVAGSLYLVGEARALLI
ncbi:MAG: bifunctional folylpolyglutamate synthase/dihydrofolate synthase, partial [Acidimicrobiia bacterium]